MMVVGRAASQVLYGVVHHTVWLHERTIHSRGDFQHIGNK